MSDKEETKKDEKDATASNPESPAKAKATNQGLSHYVVPTERCGSFNVYVQGDLDEARKDKDSKCVFITVHDIGSNHRSMVKYFEHESFDEIKKRAIFMHIDVPGQEDGAGDFPDDFVFPRLQMMGEDLVTILDHLRIKYVIGIGDGAGANIIVRFGMMHVARCLGVVLVHPVGNASTIMESFKDKFTKWKISNSGENVIAFRKFGHKIQMDDSVDKEKALQEFKEKFGLNVNKKNLNLFMDAYLNRKDIISRLEKELTCDTLVVVGSKSAHVSAAETMYTKMDKTRSSLLKVDGVGNVLEDAPGKLAHSLLLFCKGLGWLTSVQLPGVDRRSSGDRRSSVDSQGKPRRQRTISMEEYDQPNIRNLSMGSNKE